MTKGLARNQSSFLDALYGGPDRLDSSLFSGDKDRIALAMRVHANTINRARIVAVEETYPLARDALGADIFHPLAQDHVDSDRARAEPMATIGRGFADRIAAALGNELAATLARVEWAWLDSYRAADRSAMTMADISGYDPAGLLEIKVASHPATRLIACPDTVPESLGLNAPDASAVAIVRPWSEVRMLGIGGAEAAMIATATNISSIGNLLAVALEKLPESDPGTPLARLIGAGAFVLVADNDKGTSDAEAI